MIEKELKALAHAGRLEILRDIISAGNAGISSGLLAERHGLNFTTASAQLSVLMNGGLINSRRDGRSIIYSPNDKAISQVLAYLILDVCQDRPEILQPIADMTGKSF